MSNAVFSVALAALGLGLYQLLVRGPARAAHPRAEIHWTVDSVEEILRLERHGPGAVRRTAEMLAKLPAEEQAAFPVEIKMLIERQLGGPRA